MAMMRNIEFLISQGIPATLFVNSRWIDKHLMPPDLAANLLRLPIMDTCISPFRQSVIGLWY